MRAAASRSGPTPGASAAKRARRRTGSPSGTAGPIGAETDEPVAAARHARRRPADDLAPEAVVVGVADPEPPSPGAVGADPEHLAQRRRAGPPRPSPPPRPTPATSSGRRPRLRPAGEGPGQRRETLPGRPAGLGVGGELEHRPVGRVGGGLGGRHDRDPRRQGRAVRVDRRRVDRRRPRVEHRHQRPDRRVGQPRVGPRPRPGGHHQRPAPSGDEGVEPPPEPRRGQLGRHVAEDDHVIIVQRVRLARDRRLGEGGRVGRLGPPGPAAAGRAGRRRAPPGGRAPGRSAGSGIPSGPRRRRAGPGPRRRRPGRRRSAGRSPGRASGPPAGGSTVGDQFDRPGPLHRHPEGRDRPVAVAPGADDRRQRLAAGHLQRHRDLGAGLEAVGLDRHQHRRRVAPEGRSRRRDRRDGRVPRRHRRADQDRIDRHRSASRNGSLASPSSAGHSAGRRSAGRRPARGRPRPPPGALEHRPPVGRPAVGRPVEERVDGRSARSPRPALRGRPQRQPSPRRSRRLDGPAPPSACDRRRPRRMRRTIAERGSVAFISGRWPGRGRPRSAPILGRRPAVVGGRHAGRQVDRRR